MIKFDKIKIVSSIENVKSLNEDVFENKVKDGGIAEQRYTMMSPYYLYIEVDYREQELVLENMVKSLGFSDAVVAVSTESDNVNVFINSAELNYDTALSIYNMLKNETGVVAGNVIIMPVYSET